MPDNESEQSSSNSSQENHSRQEDLGSKVNKESRIQEGRRRKGGVNDDPKTPRPEARPQPQKPSDSSSDDSNGNAGSDE